MSNKHKWADVIHAYAEGKPIQWRFINYLDWEDLRHDRNPEFNNTQIEWRVKPEPKPDIRTRLWSQHPNNKFHLTFVFDGETKAFKTVEFHDD